MAGETLCATNITLAFFIVICLTGSMPAADNMYKTEQNIAATIKYLSDDIGQRSYRDINKLNMAAD